MCTTSVVRPTIPQAVYPSASLQFYLWFHWYVPFLIPILQGAHDYRSIFLVLPLFFGYEAHVP